MHLLSNPARNASDLPGCKRSKFSTKQVVRRVVGVPYKVSIRVNLVVLRGQPQLV